VLIVFFGTPEFAVPSLDALVHSHSPHRVIAVVTQPDKPRGRGQRVTAAPVKARAEALGIPVMQPEKLREEGFLDRMRALGADLGVVAAYGKILPESLLQIPRLGMINVHASLLPKYRGAAPIQRAIMEGEARTGVTIMRVVKALDAGAMILAESTPIEPEETGGELEARLATLGARLLIHAVDQLDEGTAVEQPQDDSRATYAARILKTDGVIAWDRPAQAIHDQVRALSPWPHAYTFLDGARYVLHRTRPHAHARTSSGHASPGAASGAPPGTILRSAKGQLLVQAGDGTVLEVLQLQEEGRKVLPAREFLAGRPLPAGARFSGGADADAGAEGEAGGKAGAGGAAGA
jgi:methionyl-tRNA formyltransferase